MSDTLKKIFNPIVISILVLVVGIGALVGFVAFASEEAPQTAAVERYWGNPDSKIVITAYSDFQCPACKTFFDNTEVQLKAKYSNDIKFVYKHFPLKRIHPNAQRAAEASEAAGFQGKFWEYHDLLFRIQTEDVARSWSTAKLTEYAGQLGLDTEKFKADLNGKMYKSIVADQEQEALKKGYTGTPTIELNGKKVENPTLEVLEAEIEKLKKELNLNITLTPSPTPIDIKSGE